ncbi:unnamed protein product [Prorocentrum cordatum]|uniref:Rab3 GTPase-activating protein catalytic subunit n=1 Tax=Prorocentrum cordatum TaxID=2364126 RepID=A0ABN9THZ5_9DINO|nr:unnamed protein product [Polarella glacialis]
MADDPYFDSLGRAEDTLWQLLAVLRDGGDAEAPSTRGRLQSGRSQSTGGGHRASAASRRASFASGSELPSYRSGGPSLVWQAEQAPLERAAPVARRAAGSLRSDRDLDEGIPAFVASATIGMSTQEAMLQTLQGLHSRLCAMTYANDLPADPRTAVSVPCSGRRLDRRRRDGAARGCLAELCRDLESTVAYIPQTEQICKNQRSTLVIEWDSWISRRATVAGTHSWSQLSSPASGASNHGIHREAADWRPSKKMASGVSWSSSLGGLPMASGPLHVVAVLDLVPLLSPWEAAAIQLEVEQAMWDLTRISSPPEVPSAERFVGTAAVPADFQPSLATSTFTCFI